MMMIKMGVSRQFWAKTAKYKNLPFATAILRPKQHTKMAGANYEICTVLRYAFFRCSFETNICFRLQILRRSHLPVKLLQCLSTQHRPLPTCFRYSKLYTQKNSENKRILELYKFHNSLAPSLCVVSAMNGRISETRRHRSVLCRQILKRTEALLLLRPL